MCDLEVSEVLSRDEGWEARLGMWEVTASLDLL